MSKFSSNIRNNFGFLNRFDPSTQFAADKLFYQQGRRVYNDIIPLAAKSLVDHVAAHDLAPADIARWGDVMRERTSACGDVFVYFKHEEEGKGPEFATLLMQQLGIARGDSR